MVFKFIKLNKKRNYLGFTLIELLTSISIIALITGIFLVNYRSSERRADLVFSSQILVSDIRFAQAKALGLFKYGEELPQGGWGIYFNSINDDKEYKVFADVNGNYQFDDNEADEIAGGLTIDLSRGIIIDQLKVDGEIVPDLNLVFLPPDPKTYINHQVEEEQSVKAEIILKDINNNNTATIVVNYLGLIEVSSLELENN